MLLTSITDGSYGNGHQMASWGWAGTANTDHTAEAQDAWNIAGIPAANWAAAPPPPPPEPAVVSTFEPGFSGYFEMSCGKQERE